MLNEGPNRRIKYNSTDSRIILCAILSGDTVRGTLSPRAGFPIVRNKIGDVACKLLFGNGFRIRQISDDRPQLVIGTL